MMTLEEVAYFTQVSPAQLELHLSLEAKKQKRLYPEHVRELLQKLNLNFQRKIVTIAALKGGIGKTFLSTSVAIRASMLGAKVLLIDLDPEACASNSLLTEEQIDSPQKMTIQEVFKNTCTFQQAIWPTKYHNLDIIPSSLRVAKTERIVNGKNPKNLFKKFLEEVDYDFIFFELPPSFCTLSSAAYLASDLVVIPCTPNIHALESVDLTIEAVNEVAKEFECHHIQFKILLNMYNPKRTASQDTVTILKEDHADILYPFYIRESADVQNAINSGVSIFEFKSSALVKESVEELVKNICQISLQAETKNVAPQGLGKIHLDNFQAPNAPSNLTH